MKVFELYQLFAFNYCTGILRQLYYTITALLYKMNTTTTMQCGSS